MDAALRNLVWKEWREGRWLLLAPVVASVVWGGLVFIGSCAFGPGKIRFAFFCHLQAFLFCLLGARAFASESFSGTGRFLFALPVRPRDLVQTKALLPLAVLIAAFVLSGVGVVPRFGMRVPRDPEAVFPVIGGIWLVGHAVGFAAFSLCLFLGIILEHPVATVALGLTVSLAEFSKLEDFVLVLNSRADFASSLGIGLGVGLLLAQGVVCLVLSRWYLSPERLRDPGGNNAAPQ